MKKRNMIKKVSMLFLCLVLLNTGCSKKESSYIAIGDKKSVFMNDIDNENLSMFYGKYDVEKYIGVDLYAADFEYDKDYVMEYIENSVNNNKEIYEIELNDNTVIFQNTEIKINQFYISKNPNIEDAKIKMSYYDGLDSDFPVELLFFGEESNIILQAKIYFTLEEFEKDGYDYQFIASIQYTKNN